MPRHCFTWEHNDSQYFVTQCCKTKPANINHQPYCKVTGSLSRIPNILSMLKEEYTVKIMKPVCSSQLCRTEQWRTAAKKRIHSLELPPCQDLTARADSHHIRTFGANHEIASAALNALNPRTSDLMDLKDSNWTEGMAKSSHEGMTQFFTRPLKAECRGI